MILLLSGPPGTGKTLTAEAVADKTRRPLYYLQAEDLGTDASKLGPKIKKVFEMATEWDAVILLDGQYTTEHPVWVANADRNQRPMFSWPSGTQETSQEMNWSQVSSKSYPALPHTSLPRRKIYLNNKHALTPFSVFLRELEYFKGIIFLTTNLYSTIDVAFRSRVNIHLVFSSLPFSSRLVLWRKFLSRLPGEDVESKLQEGDMEELAKWELNGREIKNAIKTVRTWCLCKGFEISLLRLEAGIKVTAPQAGKNDDTSL